MNALKNRISNRILILFVSGFSDGVERGVEEEIVAISIKETLQPWKVMVMLEHQIAIWLDLKNKMPITLLGSLR